MRRHQRGQAMVELAIIAPLLIVLMLAVGYFGHAVATQQNLNAAARSAARKMAIESTDSAAKRMLGNYSPSADRLQNLGVEALRDVVRTEQLSVRPETLLTQNVGQYLSSKGSFEQLDPHRFLYLYSEEISPSSPDLYFPAPTDRKGQLPNNLRNLKMGIGAVFYGGTLRYKLNEMEPIARYIGLNAGIQLHATSLMPAELPLRGSRYGLLEVNPWISDLITEPVSSSNYLDLID